jgi:hypothetical protein
MGVLIFKAASLYIGTCQSINDKITAIDAIQAALLITAMKAAEGGDISQYSLNDGKTIIQTSYRTAKDIMESYESWEVIKNKLINRKQGRVQRLVDKGTFDGSGCH